MPSQGHHHLGPDVSDLGSNLADLILALAKTPAALVVGGLGLANRLMGGVPRETHQHGGPCIQYICDGGIVRHHYRYCCVPSCYGCTRCGS